MHLLRRTSIEIVGRPRAAPIQRGSMSSGSQPRPNPSPAAGNSDVSPRPYKDLPGPRGLPFIGTFLDYVKSSNRNKMSRVVQQRVAKYGMTFREKMFPGLPEQVVTCSPQDVETVLRADGPWPYRPTGGAIFRKLRKAADMETGVLFS